MKITYKCEHYNYDFVGRKSTAPVTTITYESENVELDSILEDFASFLRGAGFQIDGYLDVVPHDDELPEVEEHSPHFYDEDRNK